MPVTTIKRCQSDPDWHHTVTNWVEEVVEEPGSGLSITYFDQHCKEGSVLLAVSLEDALLIRDAINQLYPPDKFPAK